MTDLKETFGILSKIKKVTYESLMREYRDYYEAKKSDGGCKKETRQLEDLDILLTRRLNGKDLPPRIDLTSIDGKRDMLRQNLSIIELIYSGVNSLWAIENLRDDATYNQMESALGEISKLVEIIIGNGMNDYVILRLYQFNQNEQGYINLLKEIRHIFRQSKDIQGYTWDIV